MFELSFPKAAGRTVKLERPQEIGCLFEVWSDCVDLVYQVLHTYHAVFSEIVFDDLVVGQRKTLFIDLAIATLCPWGQLYRPFVEGP